MTGRSFVLVMTTMATACSNGGSRVDDAREKARATLAAAPVEWTGETPSGFRVRLTPDRIPVVEGTTRLTITVDSGEQAPQSIDLVAPEMPTHGVVRFPVESEDGRWVAAVEIPMNGEWIAYVNFDGGSDAAAIRFTAVAADTAAVSAHHH